jgi:hypothetical protein
LHRLVGYLKALKLLRHHLAAALPFLLKFAPSFQLPPVGLICCSTDLGLEAVRFFVSLGFSVRSS